MTNSRQTKYLKKMYAMGFNRHTLFIHQDDQDLLELVRKRMEKRVKDAETKAKKEEQVWL